MTNSRPRALLFAFAGVMFLLYPAVRPWHDETTAAGAQASMGSGAWVASHLFAMLGFIAVPLAVHGLSRAGFVLTWVGAGLTLPYYGAETFGLHGAARAGVADLVSVADHVRYSPVAATMFVLGLVALAAGAIMTARAVVPRTGGVLFALGFVLFLPQFFLPAPLRIAHGVLLAAGCWWLAATLLRAPARKAAERG